MACTVEKAIKYQPLLALESIRLISGTCWKQALQKIDEMFI